MHFTPLSRNKYILKGTLFTCQGTTFTFLWRDILAYRIITNAAQIYRHVNCTLCDYRTKRKGVLRNHLICVHNVNSSVVWFLLFRATDATIELHRKAILNNTPLTFMVTQVVLISKLKSYHLCPSVLLVADHMTIRST